MQLCLQIFPEILYHHQQQRKVQERERQLWYGRREEAQEQERGEHGARIPRRIVSLVTPKI